MEKLAAALREVKEADEAVRASILEIDRARAIISRALTYAACGAAPSDPATPVAKILAMVGHKPTGTPSLRGDVVIRRGTACLGFSRDPDPEDDEVTAVVARFVASRVIPPWGSRFDHFFYTRLRGDDRRHFVLDGVAAAEGWPEAAFRLAAGGSVHFFGTEAEARKAAGSSPGAWALQRWDASRLRWAEHAASAGEGRPSPAGGFFRGLCGGASPRYVFASEQAARAFISLHELDLAVRAEKP